jgi:hypothetical protein
MYLKVKGKDINNIGYKVFDNEGDLTIVSDGSCYGLEDILLRNILKCFGDDYKVTDSYDYERPVGPEDSREMDVAWDTNLPWEVYCKEKDTNEVTVEVFVNKSDISCIGYTAYGGDDNMTKIVADGDICLIEAILLRSILKCFGEQYHIIEELDVPKDMDDADPWDTDLEFVTNLPWEVYMNDTKLNDGSRTVEVEESDMERIGCQTYGDWVLCYKKTAAIEYIFLSSILKCWDEEYCIEEIETYTPEESPNGKACVKFYTSLEY